MNALQARWNRISLRTKITGVTVLMLTLGLLVSGVGTLSLLRTWVLDESDKKLTTLAQGNLLPYLSGWEAGRDDIFIALYGVNGAPVGYSWDPSDDIPDPVVPQSFDFQSAVDHSAGVFTLKTESGVQLFRAVSTLVTVDGSSTYQPVIIAVSMANSEKLLAAYLAIYLGLGLGVVILGGAFTRMLVTSTFSPLRRVEETAAQIADGDFSQRMNGDTPNTEVGRLNRSLNIMLNRIDTAFSDRAHTIAQMRRFVGDASHELRTPLVSVRGYAELYRMGALPTEEDVAGAMERIEKEAIRMAGLVEDLLELARIDEAQPLELSRIDLLPLARDAVFDANAADPDRSISLIAPLDSEAPFQMPATDATTAAPVKGMQFGMTGPIALAGAAFSRLRPRRRESLGPAQPPATEPSNEPQIAQPSMSAASADNPSVLRLHPFAEGQAVVMGVENKLRQVLANLVANALRYTPPGSPLEIRVSENRIDGYAEVAVIDHGDGIPVQVRGKIFQRFWRADTSRARETGGSGLGLAIVASLVAAHRGTVDVVETPGGGATFRVRIPLADPPTQ